MAEPIQLVIDELAIRNLLSERALFNDSDGDNYLSCWTEDCVREVNDQPSVRGHAELKAFVERSRKQSQESGRTRRHMIINLVVRVDGSDDATADAMLVTVIDSLNNPAIEWLYRTHDRLRRTPQGWKIAYRSSTRT